jgi:2-hydroxycyclohexanecarboxyl-CoA dehydrogenase
VDDGVDEPRVAIVTGGARGIGEGICRRLSADGFAVAVLDVDGEGATASAARLPNATGHQADVSSYEAVESAVREILERWGRIDVLVNNAGWDRLEPFLETEPDLWERLVGINLLGPINLCHIVLPHMVERGSGRVVNIASDAGRVGSSGETVYAACKGGVIAFTKSIAREMARHAITANVVCPGPADTPLMQELRSTETGERIMDAVARATPLRRLAQPEDVAGAVAYFASPEAAFVTGQVLSVSGGLTMAG